VVTDGNHKCYRQRCLSDEGTLKFGEKLVTIGCNNSPNRNSYFCESHKSTPLINSYELDEK
jgi:hypothetical protein